MHPYASKQLASPFSFPPSLSNFIYRYSGNSNSVLQGKMPYSLLRLIILTFLFLSLPTAVYTQIMLRDQTIPTLTIRSQSDFRGDGFDKALILRDSGGVSSTCFELPDPGTGTPPFRMIAKSVAVIGAYCEFWGDGGCRGVPNFSARDGDAINDLRAAVGDQVDISFSSYACFF
ncbi:hypothetical protein TWF281_007535 [Arthrobotrys megalospora]